MAVAQKLEGGSSWPLYNIDYVDKPILDLKVSKTSIPRAVLWNFSDRIFVARNLVWFFIGKNNYKGLLIGSVGTV